jgi:hypothetical protein
MYAMGTKSGGKPEMTSEPAADPRNAVRKDDVGGDKRLEPYRLQVEIRDCEKRHIQGFLGGMPRSCRQRDVEAMLHGQRAVPSSSVRETEAEYASALSTRSRLKTGP